MQRRSFFSRFAAVGTMFGFSAPAIGADAAGGTLTPARHEQDGWFDQLPDKHRVVFDTWTAEKFRDGVVFAGNYLRVNRDEYKLADKDVAVVIVARHHTAPFAFNDAMWAKYGKHFSERMTFVDPKTKEAPAVNLQAAPLANLVKQGVHFAVCNLTTRAYVRIIAEATKRDGDEIYKELTANTVGNAHFVPAGVVAVSRAQEYGYTHIAIG